MTEAPIQAPAPEPYDLITETGQLVDYLERFTRCPVVAVDTESNSLHRFTERVSLIQLTGREADGTLHHAVVDPLVDVDISLLGPTMADPEVVTIFHGADFDVVSLKRDYGFSFANVYDTMIAARAAGVERFGLADLARGYFGVALNKKYQKHDWSARPLCQEALDYAHLDTRYLPEIMDRLKVRVTEAGRDDMVAEECTLVAERVWSVPAPTPDGYVNMKGAARLPAPTQQVLRALYGLRIKLARNRDRPPFKVLGNDLLIAIAQAAPENAAALEAVTGRRHRVVRRHGPEILEAVAAGRVNTESLPLPRSRSKGFRFAREDDALFGHLREWRNRQARTEGVEPALVFNNQALQELSHRRPESAQQVVEMPNIRRWQVRRYAASVAAEVVRFMAEGASQGEESV